MVECKQRTNINTVSVCDALAMRPIAISLRRVKAGFHHSATLYASLSTSALSTIACKKGGGGQICVST